VGLLLNKGDLVQFPRQKQRSRWLEGSSLKLKKNGMIGRIPPWQMLLLGLLIIYWFCWTSKMKDYWNSGTWSGHSRGRGSQTLDLEERFNSSRPCVMGASTLSQCLRRKMPWENWNGGWKALQMNERIEPHPWWRVPWQASVRHQEMKKLVKRSHSMPEDRLDEGFSLSASERGGRMRLRMRDLIAVRRTRSFH